MDSLVSCEDSEICPGIWVPQVGNLLLFDLGFGNWVTLEILSVDDILSATFFFFFFSFFFFLNFNSVAENHLSLLWISPGVSKQFSSVQLG